MVEIRHRQTSAVLLSIDAVHLQGATLAGADLRGAALAAKDLRQANFHQARLDGADLRRADLRGAWLGDTTLSGADLRWARLQGAWLKRADLSHADLRKANLQGAHLLGTSLLGADLRETNLSDIHPYHFRSLQALDLRGANLRDADIDRLLIVAGQAFPGSVLYDPDTRWPNGLHPEHYDPRGGEDPRRGVGAEVLFADSDPERIKAAASRLERDGFRAGWVTNGLEALASVRRQPPAVLVARAMLQFVDGFELIDQLRRLYPDHQVPVILLLAPSPVAGDTYGPPDPPVVKHIIDTESAVALAEQIKDAIYQILGR